MGSNVSYDCGSIRNIALGVLIAGTSYFGLSQYEQSSKITSEKASLEQERSRLSSEVEQVNESLTSIQEDLVESHAKVAELIGENTRLKDSVAYTTEEKNDLDYRYDSLLSEYNRLSDENRAIIQNSYSSQEVEQYFSQFAEQTKDVVFYSQFEIHNYKTGESYRVTWEVPSHSYFQYRINTNGHVGAQSGSQETIDYIETSVATWEDTKTFADSPREVAPYDDEVYANLVLQVTHQLKYVPTQDTKYPLESFAEGSGGCDTLAVFAAALMKAGGLDSAVILGTAKESSEAEFGGAHAMVGVALDEAPDDHNRESIWYVNHGSKRYYLAEATWPDPFDEPWNYDVIGTAVGDRPWAEFSDLTVVETPLL